MVAPLVILTIVEFMQIGLYFYETFRLGQATSSATRQIQVGSVANTAASASDFKTQFLCPLLGGAMSCTDVTVSIQTVPLGTAPNGFYAYVLPDQSDIIRVKTDGSQTPYCPGQPGSYVYVQVAYAMPVFSPAWKLLASLRNGNSIRFLNASSVFRNEPYASGSQPQASC